MKKFYVILAALLLCFMFNGCADANKENTNESTNNHTTAASTQQTTPSTIPTIRQKPLVAVSVPTVTEITTAEDGSEIFRYIYQNISLTVQDQEVADKIIIDFLNRVDKSVAPADDIRQQALAAYTGLDNWIPYLYNLTYSPTRIDQGILSLYGTNVVFSGSSHPSYDCVSVNYDLITGNYLTLGSILQHADKLETLKDLVLEALDAVADEKYLRGDYIDTVSTRFSRDESYDEDWFFTNNGICFYFAPYEIAPYSSGVIIVEIPYEKLLGVIGDAFFPAEQDTASGDVKIKTLKYVDLTAFTQIGELTLNQGGTQLIIYTDDILLNPRISVTDPLTGERYIAFATQHLTPGDAIIIEANQSNLENLSLIYEYDDNPITLPIVQN